MRYIYSGHLQSSFTIFYLIDPCETYPQISSEAATPVQLFDSEWLYLCGEGFTQENAEVVCRENAQAEVYDTFSTPLFTQIRQYPIATTMFHCYGFEQSLCNCSATYNTECDDNMIAVVQCKLPGMKWLSVNVSYVHNGMIAFICDTQNTSYTVQSNFHKSLTKWEILMKFLRFTVFQPLYKQWEIYLKVIKYVLHNRIQY